MYWSKEDSFKLLGLILFFGSFFIVFKQLFAAQERLDSNETARKKKGAEKSQ